MNRPTTARRPPGAAANRARPPSRYRDPASFLAFAPTPHRTGWAAVRLSCDAPGSKPPDHRPAQTPYPRRSGRKPRYVQHGAIVHPRTDASAYLAAAVPDLLEGYRPTLVAICSSTFLSLVARAPGDAPAPGNSTSPDDAIRGLAEARGTPVQAYRPAGLAKRIAEELAYPASVAPDARDASSLAVAVLSMSAVPEPAVSATALAAALAAALGYAIPPSDQPTEPR